MSGKQLFTVLGVVAIWIYLYQTVRKPALHVVRRGAQSSRDGANLGLPLVRSHQVGRDLV